MHNKTITTEIHASAYFIFLARSLYIRNIIRGNAISHPTKIN